MKVLPRCQPESSEKGADDNGCTEIRRGRIHLPTTAPHNEGPPHHPLRAQPNTHRLTHMARRTRCSSSVHTLNLLEQKSS